MSPLVHLGWLVATVAAAAPEPAPSAAPAAAPVAAPPPAAPPPAAGPVPPTPASAAAPVPPRPAPAPSPSPSPGTAPPPVAARPPAPAAEGAAPGGPADVTDPAVSPQAPAAPGEAGPSDGADVLPEAAASDEATPPLEPPAVPSGADTAAPPPPPAPLPPVALPDLRESPVPLTTPVAGSGANRAGGWFWSMLVGVAAVAIAILAGRARQSLRPRGVLPFLARVVRTTGWIVALAMTATGIAAVLPPSWWFVVPWVLLALGVLTAWSLRSAASDVAATVSITSEGRVRPGWLVQLDGTLALVERVGLRATSLRDELGHARVVSNRRLLDDDVRVLQTSRPPVRVEVVLPTDVDPALIRERLTEAALVSPWRAPDAVPVVDRGDAPGAWRVTVDVLDVAFVARHRATVRELIYEGVGVDG